MTDLYPLRFAPIFRHYLWGGRRLGTLLGKPTPTDQDTAESWEIVDRGADQSCVLNGRLAGLSLGELVHAHGKKLLGRHQSQARFPLLLKFLDAHSALSVQVHPNDHQAARLSPPDFGKTEAWVVLHADPGSSIYAGLKADCDRASLVRALEAGDCADCLHHVPAKRGDCFFLPAGSVHAIGAGLLIAEIQQSSDVTFRLHDWNRIGPDGQPRPLHIAESLAVIDFDRGPINPQRPLARSRPHIEQLVACEHFVLDRWQFKSPEAVGGDDRCHLLVMLTGTIKVPGDPSEQPLRAGQCLLLPASVGKTILQPLGDVTLLDIYLA